MKCCWSEVEFLIFMVEHFNVQSLFTLKGVLSHLLTPKKKVNGYLPFQKMMLGTSLS